MPAMVPSTPRSHAGDEDETAACRNRGRLGKMPAGLTDFRGGNLRLWHTPLLAFGTHAAIETRRANYGPSF